jgi:hypothetical protein
MAKTPILPLVLGAGALFYLTRKKEDEKETLPDVSPDWGKPEQPSGEPTAEDIADRQAYFDGLKFKRKGYTEDVMVEDLPFGLDPDGFYSSDDCNITAIGGDFEKPYIIVGEEPDEQYVDPVGFWKYVDATTSRPNDTGPNQTGLSTAMQFSLRLFEDADCYEKIPKPGAYATREAYDNAWTHFLNAYPAFSQLFMEIHENYVTEPMMDAWAAQDPVGSNQYEMSLVVQEALENFPNESVNEITNQAYYSLFYDDANAPDVIDPANPAHDPYKQAWLDLRDLVVQMK